jgi:hypothetical protein
VNGEQSEVSLLPFLLGNDEDTKVGPVGQVNFKNPVDNASSNIFGDVQGQFNQGIHIGFHIRSSFDLGAEDLYPGLGPLGLDKTREFLEGLLLLAGKVLEKLDDFHGVDLEDLFMV